MHKGSGGGLAHEGELIEVVEVTVDDAKRVLAEQYLKSPPWTLYGMMWFLNIKLPLIVK